MTFTEKPLGDGKHWRKFYDSQVLRWWHLPPKPITLTIERVTELDGRVGRESKMQLMARFKGAKLPFALNATNCTTLEQLYGEDPHAWFGKRMELYVTTTEMNGKTVNCIRMRKPAAGKPGADDAAALNESAPQPKSDADAHDAAERGDAYEEPAQ